MIHGMSVELRERVRGAAKGSVHSPIHLVQARGNRLPLLTHILRRCDGLIEAIKPVAFVSDDGAEKKG